MCRLDSSLGAETASHHTPNTTSDIPDLVPQDRVSQAAYTHAEEHLQPSVLAHSLRVFLYARGLSARQHARTEAWHSSARGHLLFTACIFHDFGACSLHDDGEFRFEIEGADAAVSFLKSQGNTSEADQHEVWVAIACHTSPHIGERISALARIIREAALLDFHRLSDVQVVNQPPEDTSKLFVIEEEVKQIEALFPRDSIEKVLANSLVAQAQRKGRQGKAPGGSWPGDLLKAAEQEPDWQGVNKAF